MREGHAQAPQASKPLKKTRRSPEAQAQQRRSAKRLAQQRSPPTSKRPRRIGTSGSGVARMAPARVLRRKSPQAPSYGWVNSLTGRNAVWPMRNNV